MSECPLCFNNFNNQENKPYLMTCGDTICSKCINYYEKNLEIDTFQCPTCCNDTKSTGYFNNVAIALKNNSNQNQNQKNDYIDEFFELLIRNKTSQEKISIKVKKEYTIGEIKDILYREKKIPIQSYHLAFKKPLNDENTLEFYGITKTVTITQISDLVGGI
jgi:hypothetical protein